MAQLNQKADGEGGKTAGRVLQVIGPTVDVRFQPEQLPNLMDALITAELLLNKNIYCDSFLDAYRKK